MKILSWNDDTILYFFVEKFDFFLTLTKKIGNIKKVLPIFQNCHNFSSFETVFFVFLHACQFCTGNHVFFNAVWRRVSCLIITCFFKIQILRLKKKIQFFSKFLFYDFCISKFWTVSVKLSNFFGQFQWNCPVLWNCSYGPFRKNWLKEQF